jgi:hypothetical protein
MARPRKLVPDLCLDTSTGRWAANFGGERRHSSRDRAESLAASEAECSEAVAGRAGGDPVGGRGRAFAKAEFLKPAKRFGVTVVSRLQDSAL